MTRIVQQIKDGRKVYLTDTGTWTPDRSMAKEYKGMFWIELLKILFEIAKAFGLTNLKYVKK